MLTSILLLVLQLISLSVAGHTSYGEEDPRPRPGSEPHVKGKPVLPVSPPPSTPFPNDVNGGYKCKRNGNTYLIPARHLAFAFNLENPNWYILGPYGPSSTIYPTGKSGLGEKCGNDEHEKRFYEGLSVCALKCSPHNRFKPYAQLQSCGKQSGHEKILVSLFGKSEQPTKLCGVALDIVPILGHPERPVEAQYCEYFKTLDCK